MHLPSQTLLQGGRYKIIEKIGQGGFGIAYKAYHKGLQRNVCIKEFFFSDFCDRSAYSQNVTIVSNSAEKIQLVDTFRKKFIKEGQRLATFQHANIVQVMDNFEENNTAYIVMEYIEGGSLEELITRSGALTEQKTKELILPILNAMEILHNKGLLHLDIKPANIMIRKNQSPVLIDFGISKYIETGYGNTTTAPVGISKGYAPLEQYGGSISDFTKSTDIYSLCATMYKMLTGITPPEPLQIIGGGLKSPHTLCPQLSTDLESLILKGLSVKQTDRQQSVAELINSIRAIIIEEELDEFDLEWEDPEIINERQISALRQMSELEAGLEKKQESIRNPKLEEDSYDCYTIVWHKGHCGFKNSKGKMITEFKYDYARKFFNGFAVVKLKSKYGYIDKHGNEIVPCNYDDAFDIKEGLLKVKLNGKYGFMNKNGRELTSCKYDEVDEDAEGFSWQRVNDKFNLKYTESLVKVKFDNKWGAIDKNGNDVITCKYDLLVPFTTEGLLKVLSNKKWGVINRNGNEVIPCIYDIFDSDCNYDISDSSTDEFVKVLLDKKMGIITRNGKQVTSCKYDFIDSFSEGFAKVALQGKWGYIDINGNEVISCKYDNADKFSSRGIAHVMLNGIWEDINKKGEKIKYTTPTKFTPKSIEPTSPELTKFKSLLDSLSD